MLAVTDMFHLVGPVGLPVLVAAPSASVNSSEHNWLCFCRWEAKPCIQVKKWQTPSTGQQVSGNKAKWLENVKSDFKAGITTNNQVRCFSPLL